MVIALNQHENVHPIVSDERSLKMISGQFQDREIVGNEVVSLIELSGANSCIIQPQALDRG